MINSNRNENGYVEKKNLLLPPLLKIKHIIMIINLIIVMMMIMLMTIMMPMTETVMYMPNMLKTTITIKRWNNAPPHLYD